MKFFVKIRWAIQLRMVNFLAKHRSKSFKPIHYIGGSEALPPPLSAEEEVYLLSRLEECDYGVKSILIERNLRLVVYIARKFENTGVGVEDLVSIGTIGLIKAKNKYF